MLCGGVRRGTDQFQTLFVGFAKVKDWSAARQFRVPEPVRHFNKKYREQDTCGHKIRRWLTIGKLIAMAEGRTESRCPREITPLWSCPWSLAADCIADQRNAAHADACGLTQACTHTHLLLIALSIPLCSAQHTLHSIRTTYR